MEYFDKNTKRKYVPHVIEPAEGAGRTLLAVVCSAYHEENVDDEVRTIFKFVPRVAPSKRQYFRRWKIIPKSSLGHRKYIRPFNHGGILFYDASGPLEERIRGWMKLGLLIA
jgi:glycyl-tRNA synthetase